MPANAPAVTRDRSAPYQQTFTTAQASLTNKVASAGPPPVQPYLNAPSGMVVMPLTAAACVLTWKDCTGVVNTLSWTAPASSVGVPFTLPFSATTLDTVTNVSVTVFWHGTGSY